MSEEQSLWALFFSGFISATLLPGGSEVLLAWQLSEGAYDPWSLWAAVTSGNALGGVATFLMGWGIAHYYPCRVFDKPHQVRAKEWLTRFGPFALIMSWLPLIGDPLCLMAGWLKTRFLLSLLMITLGKAIRYLLIVGLI